MVQGINQPPEYGPQHEPHFRMSQEKLRQLLDRTAELHEFAYAHLSTLQPYPGDRFTVAFQSCLLAMEHATSTLLLINAELYPSAYALTRPQFEGLVRGIWLMYAASDLWVEKLGEPLTQESARRANEGPMPALMLEELDKAPNAPAPIVAQLKEYKEVTWKGMNSYAHGGLHPLARALTGYPAQLSYDVVRNSNAITALTVQLASILSGDPKAMETVRRMHVDFADCLPLLSAT
jgi:hypothetical protein